MKHFFLLILSLCQLSLLAQNNTVVKQQAEQMGTALVKKDYQTFVLFTYPKILKDMGGKEKMAASIAKQMQNLETSGSKLLSISYAMPSPAIKEGKEWQCTIQQQMLLKIKGGKVVSKSTLIGISTDGGLHWYFVDAGERTIENIHASMKNVSMRLNIPAVEQPVFTAD